MLTIEEIGLVLDNFGLPLAVGPISDDDYKVLSGGFGELEWDYVLSTHGNSPERYEFCIKLVNHGALENVPSGAALCIFEVEEHTFSIHMIESFVRDDPEHPLKGRMVLITLMSAYLFCMAVDCPTVRVIEPVPELRDFYESFGFCMLACGFIMEAELSAIEDVFNKFARLG